MEEPLPADDDWYEVVEGATLHQGDVLRVFPVAVVQAVRNVDEKPNVFLERRNVVVLTQTCDIPKDAQRSILLAQVVSYSQMAEAGGNEIRSPKYRKKLAENVVQAFFLLRPMEQLDFPWSLVSFRDLHVSPKDEVQLFAVSAGQRPRLKSPYREHLSQSYGRFMMRVGLPSTTQDFEKFDPNA